jgi:dephospho-CoA kinase
MLIVVLGKKGSGKDTFSDYIIEKHGFIKYSFADPLKKGLQHFFNLTDEQLYDPKIKEIIDPRWGVSPRQLFQVIGTDVFQYSLKKFLHNINSTDNNDTRTHWVILFKQWYEKLLNENLNPNVIIADGRFIHEIDEIRKMGGKIIKVIRPIFDNNKDMHKSEMEMDEIPDEYIDHIIYNQGSLEDFYHHIDKIII